MKYQSIIDAFIFKPMACVVKIGLDHYDVEWKAAKTQILIQTMHSPTVYFFLSFLSNLLTRHSFPVGICLYLQGKNPDSYLTIHTFSLSHAA